MCSTPRGSSQRHAMPSKKTNLSADTINRFSAVANAAEDRRELQREAKKTATQHHDKNSTGSEAKKTNSWLQNFIQQHLWLTR